MNPNTANSNVINDLYSPNKTVKLEPMPIKDKAFDSQVLEEEMLESPVVNDFPRGIHSSSDLTFIISTMLGEFVRVYLANNDIYEGILESVSPEGECIMKANSLHKLLENEKCCETINFAVQTNRILKNNMIFKQKDVMCISMPEKDNSRQENFNPETNAFELNGDVDGRKFEKFYADNEEFKEESLTDGMGEGWNPDDMFDVNTEKFQVNTSYDPELKAYTTELDKNSDKYKQLLPEVDKIASELENCSYEDNIHNKDETEEMKFSAVIRGNDNFDLKQTQQPFSNGNKVRESHDTFQHKGKPLMKQNDQRKKNIRNDKRETNQFNHNSDSYARRSDKTPNDYRKQSSRKQTSPIDAQKHSVVKDAGDKVEKSPKRDDKKVESKSSNQELIKPTTSSTTSNNDMKQVPTTTSSASNVSSTLSSSEIAKKSTLNPNVKDFVPRTFNPSATTPPVTATAPIYPNEQQQQQQQAQQLQHIQQQQFEQLVHHQHLQQLQQLHFNGARMMTQQQPTMFPQQVVSPPFPAQFQIQQQNQQRYNNNMPKQATVSIQGLDVNSNLNNGQQQQAQPATTVQYQGGHPSNMVRQQIIQMPVQNAMSHYQNWQGAASQIQSRPAHMAPHQHQTQQFMPNNGAPQPSPSPPNFQQQQQMAYYPVVNQQTLPAGMTIPYQVLMQNLSGMTAGYPSRQ